MSFRQSVDEQKMVRVCQEMDELVKLWEKRSAEMKSLLRSLSSVSVSPQITSKVRQQTMSDTEDLWSFELSDSRKNLPPGFQTDAESPQEATQALQRMMQNPVEIGKLPGALDEFESHLSVLNTWSDLKRKIAFVKILHPKLKNKLKEHIRPYTSYGKVVKKALNLDEHLFYYKTFSSPSLTKAKANAPATIGGFSSSLLDSTADDYDDLIRKSKTKSMHQNSNPNWRVLRCYNCQEDGHIQSTCKNPKRVRCFECHEFDHCWNVCPNITDLSSDIFFGSK